MLIDVLRPEDWEELNDQVKEYLRLESPLRARSYHGLGHAVFEITQGTAQFMSHKKSIGVVLGQTSVFESLLPYYYKETYDVNTVSHLQLHNLKDWVEGLKKDTCFVLYCEDHPVTGEKYSFVDELDRLLNEKRIISLRVSHATHLYDSPELRPYTVRINSFSPRVAVAVLGERFRSPPLMASGMAWSAQDFLKELDQVKSIAQQNPALVEKIEKELAPVAKTFFTANGMRIFDRAVCVMADVSAEAVAQVLFQKLGLTTEEGWRKLDTPNMCRWSTTQMFRQWWQPTPALEDLRGMLIIGLELLNTKDFAKMLITSYEEVKALQSWDI